MRNQDLVAEFHRAFDIPIAKSVNYLPHRWNLRSRLIREEYDEFVEACLNEDPIEIADALGDIVYLCYGTAIEMGINLDAVIREIHRSNMTKLGPDGKPVYRDDGKVLKGPDYEPPQIAPILLAKP